MLYIVIAAIVAVGAVVEIAVSELCQNLMEQVNFAGDNEKSKGQAGCCWMRV
jgi:hypothetical protein